MIETKFHAGMPRRPWYKKINPLWWFGNDLEPTPPDWYRLEQPRFTLIKWYLRNPFQNFGRYVFGVMDRDFTVVGEKPVQQTTFPGRWKRSMIHLGILRLPFASYESDRVIFYAGWQPTGFFGFKLHPKAKFQLW